MMTYALVDIFIKDYQTDTAGQCGSSHHRMTTEINDRVIAVTQALERADEVRIKNVGVMFVTRTYHSDPTIEK